VSAITLNTLLHMNGEVPHYFLKHKLRNVADFVSDGNDQLVSYLSQTLFDIIVLHIYELQWEKELPLD
jgi:hypothetical protein